MPSSPRSIRLARLSAALWASLIGVLIALPLESAEELAGWLLVPDSDKVAHAVMFFVLTLLLLASLGPSSAPWRRRWLLVAVAAAAYGGVTELVQLFVPGRSAELADLLADACGAALAVLPAAAWRWRRLGSP